MRLGQIRRLAMVGIAALALLASSAPVASAKLGGFHDGFFSRNVSPSGEEDLGTNGTANLIDAASASGAAIARFNVLWCQLEPDRDDDYRAGVWNATIINVNKIINSGMRPLPILINAPVWARAPGDRPANQTGCAKKQVWDPTLTPPQYRDAKDAAYPPDDDHVPHWNEFIGRFIRCMRGIGNAGGGCPPGVTPPAANLELNTPPIQGYEIWNEPNLGKYWGKGEEGSVWREDANRFLRMVRGAFAVPHGRPIVLGGLSFPNNLDWGDRNVAATRYLERIYDLLEFSGDDPKFDAIAVHPYGAGLHTNAEIASGQVLDTYQVRNRHDDDTPVWVTEVGDDGCPQNSWYKPNGDLVIACRPNDPALQAQRLVNMWTGPNEIPAPVIIYYRLMDSATVTVDGIPMPRYFDSNRPMGVFPWRQFSNPRPAYCRLAAEWGAYPPIC